MTPAAKRHSVKYSDSQNEEEDYLNAKIIAGLAMLSVLAVVGIAQAEGGGTSQQAVKSAYERQEHKLRQRLEGSPAGVLARRGPVVPGGLVDQEERREQQVSKVRLASIRSLRSKALRFSSLPSQKGERLEHRQPVAPLGCESSAAGGKGLGSWQRSAITQGQAALGL